MKNNNMVMMVVGALVIAAAGFFGGMQYQKMQVRAGFAGMMGTDAAGNAGFGQGRGAGGFARGGAVGANRNGMAPVTGEVVSMDADSITVKLQDGSSKIVNVATSTTFSKTDTGAKTDIKTGTRIAAFGTTNSDGSITAQNVQINPMFRIRGMGGSVTPTPGV